MCCKFDLWWSLDMDINISFLIGAWHQNMKIHEPYNIYEIVLQLSNSRPIDTLVVCRSTIYHSDNNIHHIMKYRMVVLNHKSLQQEVLTSPTWTLHQSSLTLPKAPIPRFFPSTYWPICTGGCSMVVGCWDSVYWFYISSPIWGPLMFIDIKKSDELNFIYAIWQYGILSFFNSQESARRYYLVSSELDAK